MPGKHKGYSVYQKGGKGAYQIAYTNGEGKRVTVRGVHHKRKTERLAAALALRASKVRLGLVPPDGDEINAAKLYQVAESRRFIAWCERWIGRYEKATDDMERATTYSEIANAAQRMEKVIPGVDSWRHRGPDPRALTVQLSDAESPQSHEYVRLAMARLQPREEK